MTKAEPGAFVIPGLWYPFIAFTLQKHYSPIYE